MEDKRIYKVYMHTNNSNDKKYIGITKQKPEKRWQNGFGYKAHPYFWKAIKKYGWDNFKHDIILCNLTLEEAEIFEVELIKYYKAMNTKYGYNLQSGGNVNKKVSDKTKTKMSLRNRGSGNGMFGKKHSDEAKAKMSMAGLGRKRGPFSEEHRKRIADANKGKIVSEETKEKLRISNSGNNSWMFGKKHSEETKQKISLSKKGKRIGKFSEEHRKKIGDANRRRAVSQETKDKISKSLTGKVKSQETIEKLRIASSGRKHTEESRNKISMANKGKVRTEEYRERMKILHKGKHNKPRYRVKNLTTGEIFDSIKIASEKYSISETCISKACNKVIKTSCGCEWIYLRE